MLGAGGYSNIWAADDLSSVKFGRPESGAFRDSIMQSSVKGATRFDSKRRRTNATAARTRSGALK